MKIRVAKKIMKRPRGKPQYLVELAMFKVAQYILRRLTRDLRKWNLERSEQRMATC